MDDKIKNKKTWERKCPACHKSIFHTRKNHRNWFEKRKSLCKSCSKIGKYTGRILTGDHRKKISDKLKGKIPKNINLLISKNYTRIYSSKTREKMRNSRINYLKTTGAYYYPNYNLKSCKYFNSLNETMSWNGKYATNGGEYEIGDGKFFVDFYDEKRNIVIEYDESHHYLQDGSLRKKDIERMDEIKNNLQCRFFRYNEQTKELKEF